jgi:putative CocE/NonD family hydrolase
MSLITLDSLYVPADQKPLERRTDILVYQTTPLEQDIVLAGPVVCHLWAETDAPDTDFTARLIEVAPDGSTVQLSTGIIRARFRSGFDNPSLVEPGRAYEYVIKMAPVGIRFHRGMRIRLDISSSDFPGFDRNHNTGADPWTDPEIRIARQTIFHTAERPSRIVLPVLPE